MFPSVKFENPNRQNLYSRESQSYRSTLYEKLKNINFPPEEDFQRNYDLENESETRLDREKDNSEKFGNRKVLYSKRVFLGDLCHCVISFYVENKK